MKKIFYPLFIIATLTFATGCADTFYGAYNDLTGPVESIYLKPATTIYKPETEQLNAVVYPSLTENKNVVWTSDATSVATVNQSGLVTAVNTGTAIIKVTSNENSGISASCTVTVASYALRDTGPGGGLVFYDKGSTSDGWRYMEAAPLSTEWTNKQWAASGANFGCQNNSIGWGAANSAVINILLNSIPEADRAAQLCESLVFGGASDWFLPSIDELQLMYSNLKLSSVGNLSNAFYWSSSEVTGIPGVALNAWGERFDLGTTEIRAKNTTSLVRAARKF